MGLQHGSLWTSDTTSKRETCRFPKQNGIRKDGFGARRKGRPWEAGVEVRRREKTVAGGVLAGFGGEQGWRRAKIGALLGDGGGRINGVGKGDAGDQFCRGE